MIDIYDRKFFPPIRDSEHCEHGYYERDSGLHYYVCSYNDNPYGPTKADCKDCQYYIERINTTDVFARAREKARAERNETAQT